jgi:hypothetical protein
MFLIEIAGVKVILGGLQKMFLVEWLLKGAIYRRLL